MFPFRFTFVVALKWGLGLQPLDGLASAAQSDDSLMGSGVGLATGVLAGRLGELDPLWRCRSRRVS